jgi:predicted HTH transcriptional regulator
MTLQELKILVEKGEHQTLEFKKKIAHPEKVVKEIVAFANSKGGTLIIGADDDGTLSGQRFIDEEVFTLDNAIHKYIRPSLEYTSEIIALNAKKGLAIYHIPNGNRKPYHVLDEEKHKKVYFRVQDRSIQASKELIEIIRKNNPDKGWRFQYGEKEQKLMQYLNEHDFITLAEFRKIASINRFKASNTLVRLVLANVLRIEPKEDGDRYYVVD